MKHGDHNVSEIGSDCGPDIQANTNSEPASAFSHGHILGTDSPDTGFVSSHEASLKPDTSPVYNRETGYQQIEPDLKPTLYVTITEDQILMTLAMRTPLHSVTEQTFDCASTSIARLLHHAPGFSYESLEKDADIAHLSDHVAFNVAPIPPEEFDRLHHEHQQKQEQEQQQTQKQNLDGQSVASYSVWSFAHRVPHFWLTIDKGVLRTLTLSKHVTEFEFQNASRAAFEDLKSNETHFKSNPTSVPEAPGAQQDTADNLPDMFRRPSFFEKVKDIGKSVVDSRSPREKEFDKLCRQFHQTVLSVPGQFRASWLPSQQDHPLRHWPSEETLLEHLLFEHAACVPPDVFRDIGHKLTKASPASDFGFWTMTQKRENPSRASSFFLPSHHKEDDP